MKRVSAIICYTHSTEENKMLISFDFYTGPCRQTFVTTTSWDIHLTSLIYKVAVTCTLFLPYRRTLCDYIGDLTILSWFYDPSSEDSSQAGHSLSFAVWSEPSLPAWRNLMSLPTHREISRIFSAKCRGMSPRNVREFLRELLRSFSAKFAEKTLGEISDFLFFSAKTKIFRARGVPRWNAKNEFFSWADLYRRGGHLDQVIKTPRTNFRSPDPWRLHMEFNLDSPSGFGEEDLWKWWTDGRRTMPIL